MARTKSTRSKTRRSAKRRTSTRKPVVRYRTRIKRIRVRRNPRGMLSQPAVRFGLAAVAGAIIGNALDRSVLAGKLGSFRPSLAGAVVLGLLGRSKVIKGAGNKALATGGAVGMLLPTAQEYIGEPVSGLVNSIATPIAGMLPDMGGSSTSALTKVPQVRAPAAIGGARR